MTLPRSAADVLADHVLFEIEEQLGPEEERYRILR